MVGPDLQGEFWNQYGKSKQIKPLLVDVVSATMLADGYRVRGFLLNGDLSRAANLALKVVQPDRVVKLMKNGVIPSEKAIEKHTKRFARTGKQVY